MTLKRFLAVMLALLLLVGMAPELLPAAQATPSADGCTGPNSPDGKHYWVGPRVRDPWCEVTGGHIWICSYCNKEAFEETSPALGHNWSEWRTVKEATCTEKGVRKRECLRCDLQDRQEIDYAHQWGAWEPDLPGTCIQKERLVRKCKKCGALDYWTRDFGDHDWGEWETVKAPTVTQPGEEKRVCKNSPNHVETREIPATGEAPVKPDDEKPSLSITLWAKDYETWTETSEFSDDENVRWGGTVTNSGNVDIEHYDRDQMTSSGCMISHVISA